MQAGPASSQRDRHGHCRRREHSKGFHPWLSPRGSGRAWIPPGSLIPHRARRIVAQRFPEPGKGPLHALLIRKQVRAIAASHGLRIQSFQEPKCVQQTDAHQMSEEALKEYLEGDL
jgi:hypothetical protein